MAQQSLGFEKLDNLTDKIRLMEAKVEAERRAILRLRTEIRDLKISRNRHIHHNGQLESQVSLMSGTSKELSGRVDLILSRIDGLRMTET